jgi:hypothetical protein
MQIAVSAMRQGLRGHVEPEEAHEAAHKAGHP